MLSSPWKLTLGPETIACVLLDFSDILEVDLSSRSMSEPENIPIVSRAEPVLKNAAPARHELSFSLSCQSASDAASRIASLDALRSVRHPLLPLKLQAAGNASSWRFSNAKITSVTAREQMLGLGHNLVDFSLTAAGLTKVAPSALQLTRLCAQTMWEGGNYWFFVSFRASELMAGNATDGWTSAGGTVVQMERSLDLQTWTSDMLDMDDTPALMDDDSWLYGAYSPCLINSDECVGDITAALAIAPEDVRYQPITSLLVAGTLQSLPNFPYHLPADAALLQSDLRALGWTGATVTATSASAWTVEIPAVEHPTSSAKSTIGWPTFLDGYDPLSGLPIYNSGVDFSGVFRNDHGLLTKIPKQFARLNRTEP